MNIATKIETGDMVYVVYPCKYEQQEQRLSRMRKDRNFKGGGMRETSAGGGTGILFL